MRIITKDGPSPGRWNIPAVIAYGINADGALLNLETALSRYAGWILRHDTRTWLSFSDTEIEIVVNGTWDVYYINDDLDKASEVDGYSVESFFPYDWKPLTTLEIKHGLAMLTWSREDLLKPVLGLSQEKRNAEYPGERWSINGILGHVGGAEWWYLDRLGLAFPREQLPEEPQARLEKVARLFRIRASQTGRGETGRRGGGGILVSTQDAAPGAMART